MKLKCKSCGAVIPERPLRTAATSGAAFRCGCGRSMDAARIVKDLDAKVAERIALRRDPEKLARRGDPETSHEAAREIVAKLPEARRHALDAVQRWPNCTSLELATRTGDADPRKINRRLGELEKLRLVKRTGTRRCSISNRNATTWEVA